MALRIVDGDAHLLEGGEFVAERAIALAAAGFGQRRKMIRSSLRAALTDPERSIAAAGLTPTDRAEDLAPADWLALAGAA